MYANINAQYSMHTDSLFKLYCALILPYISYCAEIWGNTYRTNLEPLILQQKIE